MSKLKLTAVWRGPNLRKPQKDLMHSEEKPVIVCVCVCEVLPSIHNLHNQSVTGQSTNYGNHQIKTVNVFSVQKNNN